MRETDKQYFSKTPFLIVEVLSRAIAIKDTTIKFDLYEKEGVECYILIEPTNQKAEIYELKDKKYQLSKKIENQGKYRFENDNCKVEVDFAKVFD